MKLQFSVDRFLIHPSHKDSVLESIKKHKGNALINEGSFVTHIIWSDIRYMIPNSPLGDKDRKAQSKGLFLYGVVAKEAKKFLRKNGKIKLPPKRPSVIQNLRSRKNIACTDINHAYWRIALNLGVITHATYEHGLRDRNFKNIRLAALSTLGMGRTYKIIKDGQFTSKNLTVNANPKLKQVYELIRYTCYNHMWKLKRQLGEEFIGYRVDCIYYFDTKKNRDLVSAYFEKNNLDYKHYKVV